MVPAPEGAGTDRRCGEVIGVGRFPERDPDFERSNGMQPPGRWERLLRVVRPLTPMVVRFGLVLLLGGAAIAPGYWTAGAGAASRALSNCGSVSPPIPANPVCKNQRREPTRIRSPAAGRNGEP